MPSIKGPLRYRGVGSGSKPEIGTRFLRDLSDCSICLGGTKTAEKVSFANGSLLHRRVQHVCLILVVLRYRRRALNDILDVWGAFALSGLSYLAITTISIMSIRRHHARHVYTLWYIFFLISCCFFVLLCYFNTTLLKMFTESDKLPLYGKLLNWSIIIATDFSSELYFLSIGIMLAIVPQLLTFVVSGIFGCGSPPVLVSIITRYAILSLVKFFCVLSGILAGASLFQVFHILDIYAIRNTAITTKTAAYQELLINDVLFNVEQALLALSWSFAILALYYKIQVVRRYITGRFRHKSLHSAFMYMTRYHENEAVDNQGWVGLAKNTVELLKAAVLMLPEGEKRAEIEKTINVAQDVIDYARVKATIERLTSLQ
jgi:hypothetical protein